MTEAPTATAHIAMIGAPNAGKSTLTNRLIGAKISIVTPKAQTTRSRVTGVLTEGATQLVLIDVPGVFDADKPFEKAMVQSAWSGARAADAVVYLHDARKKPTEETERVVERLGKLGKPVMLVINKSDSLENKRTLLERVAWFEGRIYWSHIFMISAKTGDGVDDLKAAMMALAQPGPWMFPEDAMTDLPMRLIASELTREQCFLKLQEEIPYTLTVETEQYKPSEKGGVEIHQIIIVQNERQKTIVIGKDGQMLKDIGTRARQEIGKLLGETCHLYLFVKVRSDWKEKPDSYHYLGLEFGGA